MYTLKRILFVSSVVLSFSSAAFAQADWHGFYVGGNIGGALHRSTANTTTSFSPGGYFFASSVNSITIAGRQGMNNNTFTGGVEGGYNKQGENLVFGVETDYAAMRMNVDKSNSLDYLCCSGSFTVNQSLQTRWLYTLRPRFGIASGRIFYYATIGLAVTKLNYQENFSDTVGPANGSAEFNKTKAGWIGGIGASYRLPSERWSVKGEYLYTGFGRITMDSSNLTAFASPPQTFPNNIFTHSVALHSHILRGGVDYRW